MFVRTAGSEAPYELQGPIDRLARKRKRFGRVALRHRRICGRWNLGPCLAGIRRPMQLDSEMPVVQSREQVAIPWIVHDERYVIADECGMADRPFRSSTIYRKQSFTCRDITARAHLKTILPIMPVS